MTFCFRARCQSGHYNCALKAFELDPKDTLASFAAIRSAVEQEYKWMQQAWDGGVTHMVQPLGVYHAPLGHPPTDQPPTSFILMRYAAPACQVVLSHSCPAESPSVAEVTLCMLGADASVTDGFHDDCMHGRSTACQALLVRLATPNTGSPARSPNCRPVVQSVCGMTADWPLSLALFANA